MSDVAVKIDDLSKLYRIGVRDRYQSLRESLTRALVSPFARLVRPAKSQDPAAMLWALNGISFDVKQGEAVGIIGRNGAGKSTLLKVLSRVTGPTSGSVELAGRVGSLLEVGTGFHPELTGRENIYMNAAILGMRREEVRRRFDEIVSFAEVERFLDTPVKRYSSGMYTRLAFAVAAHLEPDIFIVDEVLAVGDAQFQKKCLGKMGDIASKGHRTVMFVSHNMGAISTLCSKSVFLEKGKVVAYGRTADVISQYLTGGETDSSTYLSEREETDDMDMVIVSAEAMTAGGERASDFSHDEPISIVMRCRINRWVDDTVMGFFVRDQRGRKVFTAICKEWPLASRGRTDLLATATIPGRFLMPGHYAFTFAISILHRRFIDLAEDVVRVVVSDTGSEFASDAESDSGCVFSPCIWSIADRE